MFLLFQPGLIFSFHVNFQGGFQARHVVFDFGPGATRADGGRWQLLGWAPLASSTNAKNQGLIGGGGFSVDILQDVKQKFPYIHGHVP